MLQQSFRSRQIWRLLGMRLTSMMIFFPLRGQCMETDVLQVGKEECSPATQPWENAAEPDSDYMMVYSFTGARVAAKEEQMQLVPYRQLDTIKMQLVGHLGREKTTPSNREVVEACRSCAACQRTAHVKRNQAPLDNLL
jgi:hypothetical protein